MTVLPRPPFIVRCDAALWHRATRILTGYYEIETTCKTLRYDPATARPHGAPTCLVCVAAGT